MKININGHRATSAYALRKDDLNFSEVFSCCYVGSWWFYSKYILFVVVCQHVVKSANEDVTITSKTLVRTSLNKIKSLITNDNKIIYENSNSQITRGLIRGEDTICVVIY
jgi:hypothetical protein